MVLGVTGWMGVKMSEKVKSNEKLVWFTWTLLGSRWDEQEGILMVVLAC